MTDRKPSPELHDFYKAYLKKRLRPETALDMAGDFVLDLINVFGDRLDQTTPLKLDWVQFAPFEFILQLNTMLGVYKEKGLDSLSFAERSLLHDNNLLFASLIRAALISHPDAYPGEDHFQIPDVVAEDLRYLCEHN